MKSPWVTSACFFQFLRTTPHSPSQVLHLKKVCVAHPLLSGGFLTSVETLPRMCMCSVGSWLVLVRVGSQSCADIGHPA